METKNIDGIVLGIYNYKENDALIKVINDKQKFLLIAKGFNKINSKNRNNIFIGSYVEFEVFENYGIKEEKMLLKKATLKNFFDFSITENKLVLEHLFWLLQNIETPNICFYNEYKDYLINEQWNLNWWMITYFLKYVLTSKGKKVHLTECVICLNNKDLFIFNITEGGIFCWKHRIKEGITKISFIKSIYYLGVNLNLYQKNTTPQTNKQIFHLLKNYVNFE